MIARHFHGGHKVRCGLPAVFLCALLLGLMACWWWRVELRPPRTLQLQTVLHKESQDPLLHESPLAPHTGTVKETLFKVDQDTD